MAISENERDDAAVAVRLRAIYARQARNGFRVGQRVRVTEEHRRLFPKAKMRRVVLLRFLRGTEVRVQFDELRHPVSLDERFLESDVQAVSAREIAGSHVATLREAAAAQFQGDARSPPPCVRPSG